MIAGTPRAGQADDSGLPGLEMARFWPVPFLEFEIGMKIDLCGVHRLVSQPQRDYRAVHTAVQQAHRSAVAQHVWRNTFGFQGRTLCPRSVHVLG